MTRRVSLTITGRVQGVFYRRDAAREATRLGLAGFVRNQDDGSVCAEAEGSPETVGAFIRWCRRGPENARVEDVRVEEMAARDDSDALSDGRSRFSVIF
ncbi:MAG TPA: acylphosphatase [Fibrobacteria bacterium]|nr:acylphosphatase [Fibrobacteria bacterium]